MRPLAIVARLRVPLGVTCAAAMFWLARPTRGSVAAGLGIALAGEALRIWAAGHIDKGREITRSGPYRFMRHPLYAGSTIMAGGLVVAARSLAVAVLVAAYMTVTLVAAIRTEEAALDARFAGAYSAYRSGEAPAMARRFSLGRVRANREYRAVVGLAIVMSLLWWMSP